MKIVYDNLVYSLQRAGGISSYWKELSVRLIRDRFDIKFIDAKTDNIARAAFEIQENYILHANILPIIMRRFLPLRIKAIKGKFIFHSSYNRITTNPNALEILTVHDFVHEKFYSGLRRFIHSWHKNLAIRNAKVIITVSQNTKQDLLTLHPTINPQSVHVIYNGVSEEFYRLSEGKQSSKKFLLYVGSREKYKNFLFTVDSLALIEDYSLTIVGSALTNYERDYLDIKLPGRYEILSNISNLRLNELYNGAFALIYPSSYEGFGIPLLEAMRAGCPFIALNKSSIPEVAGNAGVLMTVLDFASFKQSVEMIESNREEIIALGFIQVSKFSWEQCYQETITLYNKIFS